MTLNDELHSSNNTDETHRIDTDIVGSAGGGVKAQAVAGAVGAFGAGDAGASGGASSANDNGANAGATGNGIDGSTSTLHAALLAPDTGRPLTTQER